VRVRPEVSDPSGGWGEVSHVSVGVLARVRGEHVSVDFPEQVRQLLNSCSTAGLRLLNGC